MMDLSTGGNLDKIRTALLAQCPAPFGTVPIYQVMTEAKSLDDVKADDLLDMVRHHAQQGVDFVTVHCGVTRGALPLLSQRVTGVVSRGGAFLTAWMRRYGKENPLYEHYNRLLDIAREYDVTLSLGDSLRPGCLADATDKAQLHELKVLGELTRRAWAKGVQIIVEGPGHLPLNAIRKNVRLQHKHCGGAPFYVLGPLVTDVASGYNHIAGAIGGPGRYPGSGLSVLRHPRRTPETAGGGGRHRRGGGLQDRRPRRRYRPGSPRGHGLGFKDVPGPPGPGLGHPDQALHQPCQSSALPGPLPGQRRPVHHVRPVSAP